MKKIFYFAIAMSIAVFASCEKQGGKEDEKEATKVTVAEDALVLHLPFEDGSVAVGEGVTFASKEGKAQFVDGFIGKAYTNTSVTLRKQVTSSIILQRQTASTASRASLSLHG